MRLEVSEDTVKLLFGSEDWYFDWSSISEKERIEKFLFECKGRVSQYAESLEAAKAIHQPLMEALKNNGISFGEGTGCSYSASGNDMKHAHRIFYNAQDKVH